MAGTKNQPVLGAVIISEKAIAEKSDTTKSGISNNASQKK
jgi:hypothetical protein